MEYEPDFRKKPIRCFLYSWPALIFIILYFVWFTSSVGWLLVRPIQRHDLLVDPAWARSVLPPLVWQGVCIGIFTTWIGWKFFQHN